MFPLTNIIIKIIIITIIIIIFTNTTNKYLTITTLIMSTVIEGTFEGALQQEGKAGTDGTLCQNCEQKEHGRRPSMARKGLRISTSEN